MMIDRFAVGWHPVVCPSTDDVYFAVMNAGGFLCPLTIVAPRPELAVGADVEQWLER